MVSLPFRLLCLSRCGSCMAAMAYAGALPFLQGAWAMDAATAGGVQAAYNIANALSLLLSSWLADRLGAKRVYLTAVWSGVMAMAAFALFARSAHSAIVLAVLVAITQGGAYTPALMLVADMVPSARRGRAIGAMLAAGSFGYLLSVLTALVAGSLLDYRWGFAICALGPLAGAVAGGAALWRHPGPDPHPARAEGVGVFRILAAPVSLLLTLGYTAHCWELLGAWAWMPAFLAAALAPLGLEPVVAGVLVAGAVHLAGTVASLSVGMASDRLGRRVVLVVVALAAAGLSLSLGWAMSWSPWMALGLAFLASFFILGDSSVLSTAMTEAVPPRYLGTALAVRSVLGFGAGALSPVLFGLALDRTGQWGWAFTILGGGGVVAAVAAAALPKRLSR